MSSYTRPRTFSISPSLSKVLSDPDRALPEIDNTDTSFKPISHAGAIPTKEMTEARLPGHNHQEKRKTVPSNEGDKVNR